MAEEIQGPVDPTQPGATPPAASAEGAPPGNSPPQAGADSAAGHGGTVPVNEAIAAGPASAAPRTHIQEANGAGARLPLAAAEPARKTKENVPEMKDGFREIVETVVFVVVLVLMLKGFLAEAFVIPTGSMATTLLGYHQDVECPRCGYHSKINMSAQLDAATPLRAYITGCKCQNCQYPFDRPGAGFTEGDE